MKGASADTRTGWRRCQDREGPCRCSRGRPTVARLGQSLQADDANCEGSGQEMSVSSEGTIVRPHHGGDISSITRYDWQLPKANPYPPYDRHADLRLIELQEYINASWTPNSEPTLCLTRLLHQEGGKERQREHRHHWKAVESHHFEIQYSRFPQHFPYAPLPVENLPVALRGESR